MQVKIVTFARPKNGYRLRSTIVNNRIDIKTHEVCILKSINCNTQVVLD